VPEERPAPARVELSRSPTYTARRTVAVPVAPDRLGEEGVSLWVTGDGGRSWVDHALFEGKPATAVFTAPQEGVYGLALVPVDRDGRRRFVPDASTRPDTVVVYDATPPAVEVLSPNGGEVFGGAKTAEIAWIAEDAHLAATPITIYVSPNGGATWVPLERDLPNSGRASWTTPRDSSTDYRVKVVAVDQAGNTGADTSDANFAIDALAPAVQILGPARSARIPVEIQYRAVDLGGAGLKRVRLFITRDGGATWTEHGQDDDGAPPFLFNELNGKFGLWMTAEDAAGNAGKVPSPGDKPQADLVVDVSPPTVSLLEPSEKIYVGGRPMPIRWIARDNLDLPERCISLLRSDDGGRTWRSIVEALPNSGLYEWDAPAVRGPAYQVKVVARDLLGNAAEAISPTFALDVQVPEAVVTGPARANQSIVPVEYEIRNAGISPVTLVTLFFRPEGQKTWMRYGDDEDLRSPILFSRPDGAYELYAVCATELGFRNDVRQKEPTENTAAQMTLRIDATPPVLELCSFNDGGAAAADTQAQILWRFQDEHPLADGLTIDYSPDGAHWTEVARRVEPSKGRFDWTVPNQFGHAHMLRLTAVDGFGNKTVVKSVRPFLIDREPPQIRVNPQDVASPTRVRGVDIPYVATDDLDVIDRVEAYARAQDEPGPYQLVATERVARGTTHVELPRDGRWEIVLVAVDGTGRRAPARLSAGEPHVRVTVDTQVPTVKIQRRQSEQTGETLYVDERGDVCWQADDKLGDVTLRIRCAGEDGLWKIAADGLPNTGKASCKEFLRPGHAVRIELVARDAAGNEAVDQTPLFKVPLPAPSDITLRMDRPRDAGEIHPGDQLPFSWLVSGTGDGFVEIELQVRRPGRDWEREQSFSPTERATEFVVPDAAGLYGVRLVGHDPYGRRVPTSSVDFRVEEAPIPAIAMRLAPERPVYDIGARVTLDWTREPGPEAKEFRLEKRMGPNDSWRVVAVDVSKGTADLALASEPTVTFYRMAVKDRKDRWAFSEPLRVQTRIPDPLKLALSVDPREGARAGTSVTFGWSFGEGDSALVREMEIQHRLQGQSSWKTARRVLPDERAQIVRAPEITGTYEYRLRALDVLERELVSAPIAFRVTPLPFAISAVLEGDYQRQPGWPVTVHIATEGVVLDKESVVVRVRRDGDSQPVELKPVRTEAGRVVFNAPGEPGTWFFRVAGTAPGRAGESKEIELPIVAPVKGGGEPKVKLLSFKGGTRVAGGTEQAVLLSLGGPVTTESVAVLLSRDGGETWEAVEEAMLRRFPTWIRWLTPLETGGRYRLRVEWAASREICSASEKDFALESRPPVVSIVVPAKSFETAEIPVEVKVQDETDKVVRRELYTTWNEGRTWERQPGAFGPKEPVVFKPTRAMRYGLYVVVTNELGLTNGVPTPQSAPMAVVTYEPRTKDVGTGVREDDEP
jgi:hypothetical protein